MLSPTPPATTLLSNDAGLRFELLPHGAPGRCVGHGFMLNQHPASAFEAGGAQLWLRLHGVGGAIEAVPLLGPQSPLGAHAAQDAGEGPLRARSASGTWQGLQVQLQFSLAADAPVWFWHVRVTNHRPQAQKLDLMLVQDVGLAPYGSIRLNEYYVSHYIDLAPLQHPARGCVLAARQNLAVDGRHPWLVMGSLRHAVSFATDALQVQGLDVRAGALPAGVRTGLPGRRLQHEHAVIALQDEALTLLPGEAAALGFFGHVLADHPAATSATDLAHADAALSMPEAQAPKAWPGTAVGKAPAASLFSSAPWLQTQALSAEAIDSLFGTARRHEEHEGGTLLSFFHGTDSHVVLRAKELRTMRPHGHLLRSGACLVPDETALTSTVWMGGVFHSMLTQGHVAINRCLSTVRSWLGHYRAHGQRVFIDTGSGWQQLGLPSAFEMQPDACRWLYRHTGGLIEVVTRAHGAPHAVSLQLRVLEGGPLRVLVTHHVALGGDDGSGAAPLPIRAAAESEDGGLFVGVPSGSGLAERFPEGGFVIAPEPGTTFERTGGDELLMPSGASWGQPFICVQSAPTLQFGLRLTVRLVPDAQAPQALAPLPQWTLPGGRAEPALQRLNDILPWYLHNALIHYLAPRGLEQFSGGGWGTRDVCQGPLEMLLALDRPAPVRDLLLRVFAAQDASGDWPQWFMFFERERHLRAGDSHGDIVFWPLLGLARYLLASGDGALLDEAVPFHTAKGETAQTASVWQHVERALQVIAGRRIAGTHLAAYGHGDWNDSLQPADPSLRDQLCSAWTVTLHHQMLSTLSGALHGLGQGARAQPLQDEAAAVAADFQHLLVADGVVTGYARFEAPATEAVQWLLHPRDSVTGVHHSLLPMMHAILENLLSPEQAQQQRRLIQTHLMGPDGAHLFDRPMPYRGGPETLFQRAESSAFFGREIGVMYMHAHLRWAETLAHLGDAPALFEALARAHPIALRELVPTASLRQANCYFSSSDAAFADRHEASRDYGRVQRGEVALDGGWRVYSSGPGITLGLIVGQFLGVRRGHDRLVLDPVLAPVLDGLVAHVPLGTVDLEIEYRLGPKGCGPQALELDGRPLPFTRGANPYRLGAADVALADLQPRLAAGARRLVVHTG